MTTTTPTTYAVDPALTPVSEIESSDPAAAAVLTRVELLAHVFEELNRRGVPVCVTHAHSDLTTAVDSDVDCVVPASYDRRTLLTDLAGIRMAGKPVRVVQWLDDGAQYIAIAGGDDRAPVMVQLHVSPDFELDGHVYYTAEELIAARVFKGIFPVTPPDIEFACVLLNRIAKGAIGPTHAERLTRLYELAPVACAKQAQRFWSRTAASMLISDAQSGDWTPVRGQIARLATEMRRRRRHNGLLRRGVRRLAATKRKTARWLRPRAGLHVVFLGPDGVGKSTVIEQVRDLIAPAFIDTSYHTFAPSLIPQRLQPDKPTPHALPPRSFGASLLKAAWWSVCYTAGYAATIRPERVRGNFAVNHRYLLDAIVDPKRYRYSGPTWLLRAIWAVAPKPDLVFLLDAPAEVIQARKKEVPFAETARQRDAYRSLLAGMPYGRIINAARPLDEVVAEVNGILLDHLARRVKRQVSKGGRA